MQKTQHSNRLKSTLIYSMREFKQEGNKTWFDPSTGNVFVGDWDFSYSVYAATTKATLEYGL